MNNKILLAMDLAGLQTEGHIITDGLIHRIPAVKANGKIGRKDGWYVAHTSIYGIVCVFGNHSTGHQQTIKSWDDSDLTADERDRIALDNEARARKLREKINKMRVKTAEKAKNILSKSKTSPVHPYLTKKGFDKSLGLLFNVDKANNLLIPLYDESLQIVNLQMIFPKKNHGQTDKLFLKGGRKQGCFNIVGCDLKDIKEIKDAYICEGYATALTIHRATKKPVIVAFDAGNLQRVIATIKTLNAGLKIVIAADNDAKTPDIELNNIGLAKARHCSIKFGIPYTFPKFTDLQIAKNSDFNDLESLGGDVLGQLESLNNSGDETIKKKGLTLEKPETVSKEVASVQLENAVRGFFSDKERLDSVIRVTAGSGKTRSTVAAIIDIYHERINQQGGGQFLVEIYVPTTRLALELKEEFENRDRFIKVQALHGRGYKTKDGYMCEKHEIANKLPSVGLDVYSSLCSKENDEGEKIRCKHFNVCEYLNQFSGVVDVSIKTHAHLSLGRSELEKRQYSGKMVDYIVIDESFYQSLIRNTSLNMELLIKTDEIPLNIKSVIVNALKSKRPLISELLDSGITRDDMKQVIDNTEYKVELDDEITPESDENDALKIIDNAKKSPPIKRLLSLIYEEMGVKGKSDCSRVVTYSSESDADMIGMSWLESITRFSYDGKKIPVLHIDASADKIIEERLLSDTFNYTQIDVERNAHITQYLGGAITNAYIKEGRYAKLAKKLAGDNGLIIAPSKLTGGTESNPDAHEELAEHNDDLLLHFGALRGLDSFKDIDRIVVIGRNQPPTQEIERQARAVFGLDVKPIDEMLDSEKKARAIHRVDGGIDIVDVFTHPDKRCEAIMSQIREQETIQAIDRARLIWREKPAQIYILSNIPLPGVTVNETATWRDIDGKASKTDIIVDRMNADNNWLNSGEELRKSYPDIVETKEQGYSIVSAIRKDTEENAVRLGRFVIHEYL